MGMVPRGLHIKRLRERAGLSQQELAERIGVSQQSVGRWETGERQPCDNHFEAAVAALQPATFRVTHLPASVVFDRRDRYSRHLIAAHRAPRPKTTAWREMACQTIARLPLLQMEAQARLSELQALVDGIPAGDRPAVCQSRAAPRTSDD